MTLLSHARTRKSAIRFPLVEATALVIREETRADVAAREVLLDAAFGEMRLGKTCERLRAGRKPARGLALIATLNGIVAGTVRLWTIEAGETPMLLLGPLAVSLEHRTLGIGAALMRAALRRARLRGHKAVLLVGDAPYYARFGFSSALTRDLTLPGPVDSARFLALELEPGALAGVTGLVEATGEPVRAMVMRQAA